MHPAQVLVSERGCHKFTVWICNQRQLVPTVGTEQEVTSRSMESAFDTQEDEQAPKGKEQLQDRHVCNTSKTVHIVDVFVTHPHDDVSAMHPRAGDATTQLTPITMHASPNLINCTRTMPTPVLDFNHYVRRQRLPNMPVTHPCANISATHQHIPSTHPEHTYNASTRTRIRQLYVSAILVHAPHMEAASGMQASGSTCEDILCMS